MEVVIGKGNTCPWIVQSVQEDVKPPRDDVTLIILFKKGLFKKVEAQIFEKLRNC